MNKINVLHMVGLTQGYGVERQLLDQLEFATKQPNFIQHHVCALKLSEEIRKDLITLEIPFIVNNLRTPLKILNFIEYVRKNNITILHAHNLLRYPIRARLIPKLAGIPIVLEHEHGMIWNMRFTKFVEWTNPLSDLNICNSNAARILLKQKCKVDARIVHNGVKMPQLINNTDSGLEELYNELNILPGDKVVGFVGRLNTPKGVHAFIKMVPFVKEKNPGAKFFIIGDGPMRKELEKFAETLRVENDVRFLGFRKDVRKIMMLLDVLVVPSIREPFGNVVIEAALAQKVVVASNVDGICETVIHGETGYLVPCNEPAISRTTRKASRLPKIVVDGQNGALRPPMLPDTLQLADYVSRCLKDPEKANRMGEVAYQRARSEFSIERYVNDLNAIYRRLSGC
jgi:glycosyltransferase involved in cell wall biosynthesis